MKIHNIDFSVNLLQSLLWQYNDAARLKALIKAEAGFYGEQSAGFWQNWYNDVFCLDTANDFGLTVWAIILGVSQEIKLDAAKPARVWGFNAATPQGLLSQNQNFGAANFVAFESRLSVNRDQLRMLLKLRAMQLVSNGSMYDVNRMLNRIFPNKYVFARDNLDMSISYVFTEPPPADVLFLIQRAEIFRAPAGVNYNVSIFSSNTWGFGPYRMNFFSGNFYHFEMHF